MQGLIDINSRQRVILVANMPEQEIVNGITYNVKNLSTAHPNAIFFTDEYLSNSENIGNNIWKGGVNYTRVHGINPEQSTVTIGEELISLNFDPITGLISLVSGTNISDINFIGFINYISITELDLNISTKNNEIYSKLYNENKLIFASPINKIALYFQFTPVTKNNKELSDSYEDNEISIPNLIFTSNNKYFSYVDKYSMISPNSYESTFLEEYANKNGITNLINDSLPIYKYDIDIINFSSTSSGISKDLVGYLKALKEDSKPNLFYFGKPESNKIIERSTTNRSFTLSPINYNLAIYSSKVYLNSNESTNYIVDLINKNSENISISYVLNNNDQSGQILKSLSNINNLVEYRIYDSNDKDITDNVLNSSYVSYSNISNINSFNIKFTSGFSVFNSEYSVIKIRLIPKTFDKTNNLAKFLGVNNTYEYSCNIISNFLPLTLTFKENENKIYAGVNPYYLDTTGTYNYLNLDNISQLSENNINTKIFNNDNISTFLCNTPEDMCAILNNESTDIDIKYTLQGFDKISDINKKNLYIILPNSWKDRIYISEKRQGTNKNGQINSSTSIGTSIYFKASTTIIEVGNYAIIKTDGYIDDYTNVYILPASQYKEITI